MKFFLIIFALVVTLTLAAKPPADTQARIDAWLKREPGGIAVAWVDVDGPVFFCAGKFSANDLRSITPDTQFELGSISKVFTALLLAETERLGKVSRYDSAAKFLLAPEDPDQAALAKITLLALTTHRAGLPETPDNFRSIAAPSDDPYSTYDRSALVAALRKHGPSAPVGRAMVYSNFGAAVLGEALASAWGTTYPKALTDHVIEPLGMKATSLGIPGTPLSSELAPGHLSQKRVANWTLLVFAPAGAVRSTARDMAKFLTACLGKSATPLSIAIAETLKVQNIAEDFSSQIGLGWFIDDHSGRPLVSHGGATAGSNACIVLDPTTGRAVTILTNRQADSSASELAYGLLGATPPLNLRQNPPVIEKAADYVGQYILPKSSAVIVTENKGALYVRKPEWRTPVPLRKVSPDHFAIMRAPAEISFERDASGKIIALIFDWAGNGQHALRIKN